jgi:hypothetical protein
MRVWCLVAVIIAGCEGAAPEAQKGTSATRPPPAAGWDGLSYRAHLDRPSGVALDLPVLSYRLEARHYPEALPHQARHILTLSGGRGDVVVIDVFANPRGLPLGAWFEEHLGFMRDPTAVVVESTAGRDRAPALLVEQPASPQAPARTSAVFAAGARVLRVTCPDADDPQAREVFARVLASLAAGGRR